MNSKANLKAIKEFFYEIEIEHDLFNYAIDNVYFWKVIRFKLFLDISKQLSLFGDAHPDKIDKQKNNKSRAAQLYSKVSSIVKREVKFSKYYANKIKGFKDVLILRHARLNIVDGKNIDPYTYFLERELREKYKDNLQTLEMKYFTDDRFIRDNYTLASESVIEKIVNKLYVGKIKITDKDNVLLNKITDEITNRLDININLKSLTFNMISIFKLKHHYFYKLFKRLKTKEIYLVCSYNKEHIISAAHDNNIIVNEMQHGVMSKYHVGYSFPIDNVPYFPDRLFAYGEYWINTTDLPMDRKNIIMYGSPFFNERIKQYKNAQKETNSVIFISQGTISKYLSDIAYEFAKNHSDYKVIFKLHPSEYNSWSEIYPTLTKGSKLNNFIIIDSNEKSLYQLFAETEYQVGVYSTALYEGMAMGVKTVLVSAPGIEHMEYLIQNNFVHFMQPDENLLPYLKSDFRKDFDVNTLYLGVTE